ncbi:hypothetical protein [Frankia sp. AgB32]|uniref:COG4315 family predicted lipoprotein n=1 Tax=Frankia sp. AgB32 TaxID=631119 RepID=UPI00200FD2DA|nr:hypothetical protein [Frankia sp. AgB32]MCK9897213.1 hypothetical protein [Frankia sp. AgB32]
MKKIAAMILSLGATGLVLVACGSDGESATAAGGTTAATTSSAPAASPTSSPASGGATTPGPVATLDTSTSRFGPILVDGGGRTLYLFGADQGATSMCSENCAKAWPPYVVSQVPEAGSGVASSEIGTTTRADGTLQVTYHGHPLYRFAKDTTAGAAMGQGIDKFGGKWFVVGPDGNSIEGG